MSAKKTKLTVESVAKIRPKATRQEIPDAVCPGLYLVVQPSGAKSWAVRYRANGVSRKLTLGPYPRILLAEPEAKRRARVARHPTSDPPDARGLARRALAAVQTGTDPVAAKAERKARQAAGIAADDTVAALWGEFCARRVTQMRPGSAAHFRRHADRFLPLWGGREIGSITKRDCIAVIDVATERGPSAGNTCHMVLSSFFTWAVARDILDRSPMTGIKKRAENARERALSDTELAQVWKAAEKIGGPFGGVFKVLVLTGARRGEVAGMRYSEIDFDARTWSIPAERTKNGESHTVFLSDAALRVIDAMPRFEGCDYVFTSQGRTPSANFSKAKEKLDECHRVRDLRTHDLRRSFATGCQRLGFKPDLIERLLNHQAAFRGVKKVYQRYEYADEMRAAWDRWAAHIEALTKGRRGSNVVGLRA
jgi:integrase